MEKEKIEHECFPSFPFPWIRPDTPVRAWVGVSLNIWLVRRSRRKPEGADAM